MIFDPKTGIGLGGSGSALRSILNPREFVEHEIPNVHTHVFLRLSFALHGFTGTYTIARGVQLSVRIRETPKEVAAYHLGLPEVTETVKNMKLEPDNWGHVNFTEAFFDFSVFRVLSHPRKVEDPESHDRAILRHCTGILNYLLDLYSLSTENYSIRRVSPKDFVSYVAWHTLPPEEMHFNHTTVYFPNSTFSFEAPETGGDLEQMQRAMDFGKLRAEYVLGSAEK